MKRIGVTGSIASGKSTVSSLLQQKGALVIDADRIAREVVEPDMPAWQAIVGRFGSDILLHDRSIDRRKLGKIVFDDSEALAFLNSAIHPQVIAEIDRRIHRIEAEGGGDAVVVVDVPLLIEVGLHTSCDLTVVVTADERVRLERLIGSGLSKEEAESRIAVQEGKEALEEKADIIIRNDASLEDLAEQVDRLWRRIQNN